MNKIITVTVKEKPWPNPYGAYRIEVNSHELEVDQKCVDRIHDLVEGKWDVEFDGGIIVAYGSFPRSKPPRVCACGTRIPFNTFFCNECFEKLMRTNV